MRLRIGKKDLYIDLGAEQWLYAERDTIKIAIEIKSFIGDSDVSELHDAVGQYVVYHDVLKETQPHRQLYLAIPHPIYISLFELPLGELLLKNERLKLLTFDIESEVIIKWIPTSPSAS